MLETAIFAFSSLIITLCVLLFLYFRERSLSDRLARRLQRYKPIMDIERERNKIARESAEMRRTIDATAGEIAGLTEAHARLAREVAELQGTIDLAEIGHYDLEEDLESSETYRKEIERLKEKQKKMLAAGQAALGSTAWMVGGSAKEGQKMVERAAKLALRAFNNEAEVTIARVSWRNFDGSRERIKKSAAAIDKLNESNTVALSPDYISLKLAELEATHKERLARHQERERLREEREAAREEEKAQREIKAAIERAEKNVDTVALAIERARAEIAKAEGAKRAALERRIKTLEEKLLAAQQERQRAQSMAEQTRIGHVYIISNLGAFGRDVFKVGMTRRLDPLDRVRELGDASVPFPFDVHALIFTDDAPKLERDLHLALDEHRLNLVNGRKEFFRATPEHLKEVLRQKVPQTHFIDSPYSQDLVQTAAIRKERKEQAQRHRV